MDPVLVILRAYLRAVVPYEDDIDDAIIPDGESIGTWIGHGRTETFIEVRVQGQRYYLVLGWAKHTPYFDITRRIDRMLSIFPDEAV